MSTLEDAVRRLVGRADHDAGGVDLVDHADAPGDDGDAGIACDRPLHAGADSGAPP